jgi:hypothetical protein
VLDLTGILFSSVMMLIVIVRTLQMDRLQPWFQKVKRKEAPTPDSSVPGCGKTRLSADLIACFEAFGCCSSTFHSWG